MLGFFVFSRFGRVFVGFIKYKLRWLVCRLQYVEAQIARFLHGGFMVQAGSFNKIIDMLRLDADIYDGDLHVCIPVVGWSQMVTFCLELDMAPVAAVFQPGRDVTGT